MTQPVFPFTYHETTTQWPKGNAFTFGKGWQFAAQPQLPLQRTFRLRFPVLQYFVDQYGNPDPTQNPAYNAYALVQFYQSVLTYQTFTYNHPLFCALNVRWSADQPFESPRVIPGGNGATEPLEIFLIEVPV